MSIAVKEISGKEMDEIVSGGGKVLVDFFAVWCGPCKMLAPVLDRAADKHGEVTFVKVDVDKNTDAVMKYGVQAMPTLVFFDGGKELGRKVGYATPDEIDRLIG